MKLSDFDFDLPGDRIAQQPAVRRDRSRLMHLDRSSGEILHRRFDDLPELLRPGDLLVLNDTRVIPARLSGRKVSGGQVELLLLRPEGADTVWRCMIRASRAPLEGARIEFGGDLRAHVEEVGGGTCLARFDSEGGRTRELLEQQGRMPLPPYIRRDPAAGSAGGEEIGDRERYQTVFARTPGAVAAPTAGLHFTLALLDQIRGRGISTETLTLHVGPGTFQPLRVENVEDHVMHEEWFDVPGSLCAAVARTRDEGGRIVAVGTTVLRVLEHRTGDDGALQPGSGQCGLFIYPGYRFRGVDALVTNFHLPRSSLLLLVAALVGRKRMLEAYQTAIREGYRFYSYGDAMFIGPDR